MTAIKMDEVEADKASMRLKDLQLTAELLSEAVAQETERASGSPSAMAFRNPSSRIG